MRSKRTRFKISKGMRETYKKKHLEWEVFRNSEIRRFYAEKGNVMETAYHFNLSRQAVYPILKDFFEGVDN